MTVGSPLLPDSVRVRDYDTLFTCIFPHYFLLYPNSASQRALWPRRWFGNRRKSCPTVTKSRPLSIFYYSRHMSIPVFIPITSTLPLPLISSRGISSVYDLLRAVWEEQHLFLPKDIEFSQLSLRTLVNYPQTYALQLRLTPHRRIRFP